MAYITHVARKHFCKSGSHPVPQSWELVHAIAPSCTAVFSADLGGQLKEVTTTGTIGRKSNPDQDSRDIESGRDKIPKNVVNHYLNTHKSMHMDFIKLVQQFEFWKDND